MLSSFQIGYAHSSRHSVPPAAQKLANRLHMIGAPVVGDQPEGNGGPWTIWALPDQQHEKRILSVGPLGARGGFDYFDVGARLAPYSSTKDGKALPTRTAIGIARAWLRQAGAPVPRVPISIMRTDGTVIGGTGLCCWPLGTIDSVVFGGHRDVYGMPADQAAIIYIEPTGRVIQANVTPHGEQRYPGGTRCHNRIQRDANGVLVGTRCFSYPGMAGIIWTVSIGGHEPYLLGPGWFSQGAAWHTKLSSARYPFQTHLQVVSSSPNRVVYSVSKGKITYHFTQVAAFPGLRFATWPLVDVERVR